MEWGKQGQASSSLAMQPRSKNSKMILFKIFIYLLNRYSVIKTERNKEGGSKGREEKDNCNTAWPFVKLPSYRWGPGTRAWALVYGNLCTLPVVSPPSPMKCFSKAVQGTMTGCLARPWNLIMSIPKSIELAACASRMALAFSGLCTYLCQISWTAWFCSCCCQSPSAPSKDSLARTVSPFCTNLWAAGLVETLPNCFSVCAIKRPVWKNLCYKHFFLPGGYTQLFCCKILRHKRDIPSYCDIQMNQMNLGCPTAGWSHPSCVLYLCII